MTRASREGCRPFGSGSLAVLGAALTLLIAASAGCDGQTGTHVGNPPEEVQRGFTLELAADSATGKAQLRDAGGMVLTLTEARAAFQRILLSLPAGTACEAIPAEQLSGGLRCEAAPSVIGSPALVLDGLYVADMLTGEVSPDVSQVTLPDLAYPSALLVFGEVAEDVSGSEDSLSGHSIVLSATFNYMGADGRAEVSLSLESASLSATVQPDETTGGLRLQIDSSPWLGALDIGDCLDSGALEITDGELIEGEESDSACQSPEDAVKDQLDGNVEETTRSEEEPSSGESS